MQNYCYHCMRPIGNAMYCRFCGADTRIAIDSAPYHLAAGTMLSNRYLIGEVLGEGGFGITYIGLDTRLAKRVAVKEFYPAGVANRSASFSAGVIITRGKEMFFQKGISDFLSEAKKIAAFSSEDGIVNVQDYFQENNTAYIVMEYLDGETLKETVRRMGPFDPSQLILMMTPVMESLEVIHRHGIIHRDISPDNIMYTKNGKLKLMDFGAARFFANRSRGLSVVLKQGYAPLEQYSQTDSQGPYTDVYGLCATIYTCITGRTPDSSLDRMKRDTLAPPSALGVHISQVQERALLHGLELDAAYRCPDMQTLMNEFAGRQDVPMYYPEAGAPQGSYTVDANGYNTVDANGYSYSPQNQWNYGENQQTYQDNDSNNKPVIALIIIVAVLIIAILGVVAYAFLSNSSSGNETTTAPPTETQTVTETAAETTAAETTEEPTTEEPTTTAPPPTTTAPPPTTTAPPPTTTAPPPTTTVPPPTTTAPPTSTGAVDLYDKNSIGRYITNYIVPRFNEADRRMSQYSSGKKYDYVSYSGGLWVGTKGSFHDDDNDKIWYFFDESYRLYFIYEHSNNNEYRYYIYDDKVIQLTVGKHDSGSQKKYYYYEDQTQTSAVKSRVSDAYYARNNYI